MTLRLPTFVSWIGFVLVLLCGPSTASAQSSVWVWNNSTGGIWTEERWVRDGSSATLTCCPSALDIVIFNATSDANYVIYVADGAEVNTVRIGLQDGSAQPLLAIVGSAGPFVSNSEITLEQNGELYIGYDGVLELRPSTNFVANLGSWIALNTGTIQCNSSVGPCVMQINGGTVVWDSNSISQIFDTQLDISNSAYYSTAKSGSVSNFYNSSLNLAQGALDLRGGEICLAGKSSFFLRRSQINQNTQSGLVSTFSFTESTNVTFLGSLWNIASSDVKFVDSLFLMLSEPTAAPAIYTLAARISFNNSEIQSDSYIISLTASELLLSNSSWTDDTISFMVVEKQSRIIFEKQSTFRSEFGTNMWVFTNGSGLALHDNSFMQIQKLSFSTNCTLYCNYSRIEVNWINFPPYTVLERCEAIFGGAVPSTTAPKISPLVKAWNSNITLTGGFPTFNDSTYLFYDDSLVTILDSGLLLQNSSIGVHNSELVIDGDFQTLECLPIQRLMVGALVTFIPTSCVIFTNESKVTNTGNLTLSSHSMLFLYKSDVALGGRVVTGRSSVSFYQNSTVVLKGGGTTEFRANSFSRILDSQITIESGNLNFEERSDADWIRSNVSISGEGSRVIVARASVLGVDRSYFELSGGGGIEISSAGSFGSETDGMHLSQSRIDIFGGSINLGQNASLSLQEGSLMQVVGGNLITDNSTLNVDSGSTLRIESGSAILSNSTRASISHGSSISIEGSIYLQQRSHLCLLSGSQLKVANGSLFVDATSRVTIDGGSSIFGVGSITGSVEILSGSIAYANGQMTNLTVGNLTQSSQATYNVTLSSAFGLGVSTRVRARGPVVLGGTLSVHVDASMEAALRAGEIIVLITSETENAISGSFDQLTVQGVFDHISTSSLSPCGLILENTGISLQLLFSGADCVAPTGTDAPGFQTPSSGGSTSIGTGAVVAAIVVPIVVIILVIALIVVVFTVPAIGKRVMPWRFRKAHHSTNNGDAECMVAVGNETQPAKRESKWERGTAPSRQD